MLFFAARVIHKSAMQNPSLVCRQTATISTTSSSASSIGFTGAPVEKTDANTRAVFGDYISIYDLSNQWLNMNSFAFNSAQKMSP